MMMMNYSGAVSFKGCLYLYTNVIRKQTKRHTQIRLGDYD